MREEDGAANHATFLKAPTTHRRSKTSEELPYIFTAPSKASTCKNYVSPINKKCIWINIDIQRGNNICSR